MNNKIVIDFSGYLVLNLDKVQMYNPDTDEMKSAADWVAEGVDLKKLVLESFIESYLSAEETNLTELDVSLEEDLFGEFT